MRDSLMKLVRVHSCGHKDKLRPVLNVPMPGFIFWGVRRASESAARRRVSSSFIFDWRVCEISVGRLPPSLKQRQDNPVATTTTKKKASQPHFLGLKAIVVSSKDGQLLLELANLCVLPLELLHLPGVSSKRGRLEARMGRVRIKP
jgi:hypothetical protein